MNNQEAHEFIQNYFYELFERHNIDALDSFLDPEYFDDDIGDSESDHIQNSKDYLHAIFLNNPTTGVDVKDVIARENVITAYLEWYIIENDKKEIFRKGVAVFVMRNGMILRRHTFVYTEGQQ